MLPLLTRAATPLGATAFRDQVQSHFLAACTTDTSGFPAANVLLCSWPMYNAGVASGVPTLAVSAWSWHRGPRSLVGGLWDVRGEPSSMALHWTQSYRNLRAHFRDGGCHYNLVYKAGIALGLEEHGLFNGRLGWNGRCIFSSREDLRTEMGVMIRADVGNGRNGYHDRHGGGCEKGDRQSASERIVELLVYKRILSQPS